jgi:hypothetical protein
MELPGITCRYQGREDIAITPPSRMKGSIFRAFPRKRSKSGLIFLPGQQEKPVTASQ